MPKQIEAIKHVSMDELKILIKKEKDKRVFERLLFIRQLYLGSIVLDACERLCISESTGYEWLMQWNEMGYEGLKPEFAGGRPPKITEINKDQLKEKLKTKDSWFTSEVKALVKRDFGVAYSFRQIIRILKGFDMHYAKPYPYDYRKPNNSEQLLEQSIVALPTIPDNTVIGFIDEASPQTTDNRQRVWSFGKPTIKKNTTKYRANTFGFYPINGKEVVEFRENSKIKDVCEFLMHICDKNPGKNILAFLDNLPTHVSNKTRSFAESHNITLVFIPKYSPQLNPIEPIWKSVRRRVSQIFAKSDWSFKESIRTTFCRLAKSKSFMSGWLEKFGYLFPKLLCQ